MIRLAPATEQISLPALEVSEDENNIVVTAELPGVDRKDILLARRLVHGGTSSSKPEWIQIRRSLGRRSRERRHWARLFEPDQSIELPR